MQLDDAKTLEQAVEVADAEQAGDHGQRRPFDAAAAVGEQAEDLERGALGFAQVGQGFALELDAGGSVEMGG